MVAYRRTATAFSRSNDAQILAMRVATAVGGSNVAVANELHVSEGTVRYWTRKQGGKAARVPPPVSSARRKAIDARRAIVTTLAKATVSVKHRTRKLYPSTGVKRSKFSAF